jgi:hypothetical protein
MIKNKYVLPGQGVRKTYFYTTWSFLFCALSVLLTILFPSNQNILTFSTAGAANSVAVLVLSELLVAFNMCTLKEIPSGYDLKEKLTEEQLLPLKKYKKMMASHMVSHFTPCAAGIILMTFSRRPSGQHWDTRIRYSICSVMIVYIIFASWMALQYETHDGYFVAGPDKLDYIYRSPHREYPAIALVVVVSVILMYNFKDFKNLKSHNG